MRHGYSLGGYSLGANQVARDMLGYIWDAVAFSIFSAHLGPGVGDVGWSLGGL